MSAIPVRFLYRTGLVREIFHNPRLRGSWADGRYADRWSECAMDIVKADDGCWAFAATIPLETDQVGRTFYWGVIADGPAGPDQWLMMTEAHDVNSDLRRGSFVLQPDGANPEAVYRLSVGRWLGAQKWYGADGERPQLRFAVWAPNAQKVDVVLGKTWHKSAARTKSALNPPGRLVQVPFDEICGGYIANDGFGELTSHAPIPMAQQAGGVWISDSSPSLPFDEYDHRPYMYRIIKDSGAIVYRTDIHSRCQIGGGNFDPLGAHFDGRAMTLDGSRSCSVIVDTDKVTHERLISSRPERTWPEEFVPKHEFWQGLERPVQRDDRVYPGRVEDLVIYELHMGALGAGRVDPYSGDPAPGTLEDALALIPYMVDLGVNAVELLPLSQFGGSGANWGYATSHYYAIEYEGGGRDCFKLFIRECHRHGIAVIMDVVYNHYIHEADRDQWMYDTDDHNRNVYYWYEGTPGDYPGFDAAVSPASRGQGGYVDNVSTAYAPRYYEEIVRQTFISSALTLAEEFHVDGFRLDQTTSIHAYNALHADGRPLGNVNAFGAKLLREFGRTIKAVRPEIILMAEDHSMWDEVIAPVAKGGMGFDGRWYADFYHHLIGDTDKGSDYAKLLWVAGRGADEHLAMDYFAGALAASGDCKVVYHESHDEAGNGTGTARTIVTAVNGAPLVGETRRWAEARVRLVAGITILSAGTPMFLFGEEVGVSKPFLYNAVLENREDLHALRRDSGAELFAYFQALIGLRLHPEHSALRSRAIDILHVHNANRVIAFRRADQGQEFLILASFNNRPFDHGYIIQDGRIGDAAWREIFNSDAQQFGGWNVGNSGAVIPSQGGRFEAILPVVGLVAFRKE
jgi:1,4-alpha-glucan branching enzyme